MRLRCQGVRGRVARKIVQVAITPNPVQGVLQTMRPSEAMQITYLPVVLRAPLSVGQSFLYDVCLEHPGPRSALTVLTHAPPNNRTIEGESPR